MQFFTTQFDYIYFFYGLAFLILACVSFILARQRNDTASWLLLCSFAAIHSCHEFIEMLQHSLSHSTELLSYVSIVLLVLSFIILFEFGRSGLRGLPGKIIGGERGLWVYGVLILVQIGLWHAGMDNFDHIARYTLCFPGALLAALVFYQASKRDHVFQYFFLVASVGFIVYAFAAGLIVRKAPFYPALIINTDTFFELAKFPIQILRGSLAIILSIVFWEYYCGVYRMRFRVTAKSLFFHGRWLFLSIAGILVCGWAATYIIGQHADEQEKQELLTRLEIVASSIPPERLGKLTGTLSDLKNPDFMELREMLRKYESALPAIRWFYMMNIVDGKIIFTIDTTAEDSPDNSPPGSIYRDAPPEVYTVFKGKSSATVGPYTDKWGTFISAFVPIINPETNSVAGVVGCDVNSVEWSKMINLTRLYPILITLLLSIIIIIGFLTHQASVANSLAMIDTEMRYREIFDNSNDGIIICTLDGRILEVNEVMCHRLGYTRDEMLQMTFKEIDACEYLPTMTDKIRRIQATGSMIYESVHRTKDKESLSVEVSSKYIIYQGEKSVLSFVRDIEERKQTESLIRENEKKYKLLFSEMMTAFAVHEIICNENGEPCDYRFLDVNPAFEKLTGLRAEKIIGRTVLEIFPTIERNLIINYGEVALTGKPMSFEYYSKELKRHYELRAFSTERGKFAVAFNDITERRNNEDLLLLERDLNMALGVCSTIKDAAEKILEVFCRQNEIDSGGIYLLNDSKDELRLVVHKNLGNDFIKTTSCFSKETYQFKLVESGKLVFGNYSKLFLSYDKTTEGEKLQAIGILPIMADAELIAVLNVASHKVEEFSLFTQKKIAMMTERLRGALLRIRADEALKEAHMFNREILANVAEGIVVYDRELRYLLWNSYMEKLTGVPACDALGKSAFEVFPHLKEEKVDLIIRRAMEKGEILYSPDVKFHIPKTGKTGYVRGCYAPYFNSKGEIIGVIATILDVTQHKADEDSLRKLSIAVEQSPALIVITDTEGLIEYVNPKFEEVTGYRLKEVLGENPRILKSGDSTAEKNKELWDTIKSGKEWRGEFHNKKKSGELYLESALIAPIFDERGNIVHFIAIKEDITEQRSLQQQLRQSQKMESLGRLAGGVAHDFNNMLQVINGFAELLLMKMPKDNVFRGEVEEINKAGKRATELTNQLLLFSRKKTPFAKEVNLNELLGGYEKMLAYTLGESYKLDMVLSPKIMSIKADPGQIEQLVMNLVINARDAMGSGGKLRILTSLIYSDEMDSLNGQDQTRPYVCLSVSDTGEGMTEEVKERIFEPFFTTKPKGRGTGLGLSIVYGIIKQHNGWITVDSTLGKGSTFDVYFPALVESEAEKTKFQQPAVLKKGGGERILLIEDENSVRTLATRILKDNGYHVFSASCAQEAIMIFNKESGNFDLIFSDIILPDQNGVALVGELRSRKPELRILLTSAYTGEILQKTNLDEKNYSFLAKPYHYEELLVSITEAMKT